MKTKQLLIVAGLLVAFGLSLVRSEDKAAPNSDVKVKASSTPPAKVLRAEPEKSDPYRVIGYLEKRDRVVTIKSGPKGTVYTVTSKAGKVLFENLSVEQLRAKAPEIHDFIKTGMAGDARVRPKIDARLR